MHIKNQKNILGNIKREFEINRMESIAALPIGDLLSAGDEIKIWDTIQIMIA